MMNSVSRSVSSAVSPICYVSQMLGLMYLKHNNRYLYKLEPPFQMSVLYFLYTIFGIIVTILHISSAPFYVIKTIYPYQYGMIPLFGALTPADEGEDEIVNVDNKQTVAMNIISPIISSVMSLSARLIGTVFLARQLPSFLQRIDVVDALLSALSTSGDTADVLKNDFRLSVKLVLYTAVISLPVNGWYLYNVFDSPDVEFWSLVWCATLVWSNLSASACEAQFVNFAWLLCRRFRAINLYLANYTASSGRNQPARAYRLCNWKSCFRTRVVPTKEPVDNSKRTAYVQKLTRGVYVSDRRGGRRQQPSFLVGLELARQCHTKLCDLLKCLSRMYQLQFVTSLSGCFMKMLFIVYFAIFGLVVSTGGGHSKRTDQFGVEEILKTILWMLFYIFRFLNIVLTANRTVKEANLTKCLLADIDCKHLDEEIREELTLFAEHTSSRRVEFSACSLFTINTRLITSAIATGTTYLVILVQFHTPATTTKRT